MTQRLRYLDEAQSEYALRLFRIGRDTHTIAQIITSRWLEPVAEAVVYNSLHRARDERRKAA